MKKLMVLGGVAALALSAFAAKPASADHLRFGLSIGSAPYVAPYPVYPAYPPYPAYDPYGYPAYVPAPAYVEPEFSIGIGGGDWGHGHWGGHDRGGRGYRGHGRRR
jgi:hypothetical protein